MVGNNFRTLASLQTALFCPRPFSLPWTLLKILVKISTTMPVRAIRPMNYHDIDLMDSRSGWVDQVSSHTR